MAKHYVYLHLDSQGRVFYVGCGKRYRPTDFSSRSEVWKQRAKKGVHVEILQEFTDRREALDYESELQDLFRDDGLVCDSPESKSKRESLLSKKKWADPLIRAKIIAGHSRPEVRKRMSESAKNRIRTPESEANRIAAARKVMNTSEYKATHKAAMNRPEVKAALRELHTGNKYCAGRKASAETLQRLSDSHKGQIAWNKGMTKFEQLQYISKRNQL